MLLNGADVPNDAKHVERALRLVSRVFGGAGRPIVFRPDVGIPCSTTYDPSDRARPRASRNRRRNTFPEGFRGN